MPVAAALRFENRFAQGNAAGVLGSDFVQTYSTRAVDWVVTLDNGWKPFSTLTPSQTASATDGQLTSAITSSAAASVTGSKGGLSKTELAGISDAAGGLVLLAGVGAALLLRRSAFLLRSTPRSR